MKLETFFENFDQFAGAPDAVAKMRDLIVQLAVRGKLVEQRSEDGTADGLLSAISLSRKQNRNDKSAENADASNCTNVDEWFGVPDSWRWVRLDTLGKIVGGGTPHSDNPTYFASDGIPWLTPADLNGFKGKRIDGGRRCITSAGLEDSSAQLLPPGTVLFSSRAPIGYVAIAAIPLATNQGFKSCIPFIEGTSEFLYYYLLSAAVRIDREASGTTFREVSGKIVGRIPVPLPPLAEQKRIVLRVDELMALCDRLEAQQKERQTRHIELTRAAIIRFDKAPTPANLNFLFHPSYSVTPANLRKTILDLAIRGKLVAQNPDDAPATATFKELAPAEIKSEDDELPAQWMLVPLGKMGEWKGGGTPSKSNSEFWVGEIPWVSPKDMKVPRISDAEDHISEKAVQSSSVRLIPAGSVLMVVRGMILARAFPVALTLREVTINQDMKSLYPSEPKLREFLLIALRALEPKVLSAIERSSHGTCKLRTEVLESILIPVPPLSEQWRIAAKIDQLMSLVDQLESQLVISQKAANELLDAVVHKLLRPTAKIIEFPRREADLASRRAAIGCYAIEHLARNPSFGRTMLMKACYLAETHLGFPLGWQPMRQAAGPWDPWIQDFESLGTRGDWFTVTEKALHNGRSKFVYSAGKALTIKAAEAVAVLGRQKTECDRLLNLFADKNTEEAEIITTLFAAWNDFLFDGKTPTDDEIISEVRDNWHPSKQRFTPAILRQWLDWMRGHDLIPRGCGPRTRQQLTLRLK